MTLANDPRPYLESKGIRMSLIIFVVVVTLLALAGTGLGAINSAQNSKQVTKNAVFAACLANYNNEAQAATEARANLNAQQQTVQQDQLNALGNVVLAVANAKSSAGVTSALATYRTEAAALTKEAAAINKLRAENPVPAPPSEVCKQ